MAEIKLWTVVFFGGLLGTGLTVWNLFVDKPYGIGFVLSIGLILIAIILKNRDL